MQTSRERGRWERIRMQCLCSMQPYSKSKLTPQDIMKFPWEGSEERRVKKEKPMSHEEIMERYRAAKKRAGL